LLRRALFVIKVFKEEYNLNIEVLHHSQYLLRLVEEEKITLNHQNIQAVYHDPCELGAWFGYLSASLVSY